ncbi:transcription accessory protein [Klebsiella pneumoniae]|uniref:Transcription accessory protein n=1 Tax=Klebsiella pneumoniae TaxID=573 RepID=A0A378A2B5_KLEPN|nr:transcription accessory protein [Klebsiella pneumoniae]
MMNDSLCRIIAGELQARAEQVEAAVRLLDEGNTVPFIARYRKEVTGGLDDTQLRNLETRLGYLRELEDRRQAILKSIAEQGKLTDALEKPSTPRSAKPNWKISTCPTSRSAVHAGRSLSKPGSNRWLTCCGTNRPTIRKRRPQNILMPIRA